MGFREYNPSLNRFLTRDLYDGAMKDMALGSDPWTTNRYAFAGGNPIAGIELDGHCPMRDDGGCDENAGYTGPAQVAVDSGSTPPEVTQTPEASISKKFASWGKGNPTKAVGEELFIKPAVETYEACAAAFEMENYATNWQQCKTGAVLTGMGFTGGGKIFGIGVRTAEGLAAARLEAAAARILTGRATASAAKVAADTPAPNATVRDLIGISPGNRYEPFKGGLAYSRTDDVLLKSVFEPTDGVQMRLYPGSMTMMEGNHRRFELLDRARDPLSQINLATPIYIKNWIP